MTTTYKNYSSDIEKIEQLKQLSSTYQLVMTKIKQLESQCSSNKKKYKKSSIAKSPTLIHPSSEQNESFLNYEQRKRGLYQHHQAILLKIDLIQLESKLKDWIEKRQEIGSKDTYELNFIDQEIEIAECKQYQIIEKLKTYQSAKQFSKVRYELKQPSQVKNISHQEKFNNHMVSKTQIGVHTVNQKKLINQGHQLQSDFVNLGEFSVPLHIEQQSSNIEHFGTANESGFDVQYSVDHSDLFQCLKPSKNIVSSKKEKSNPGQLSRSQIGSEKHPQKKEKKQIFDEEQNFGIQEEDLQVQSKSSTSNHHDSNHQSESIQSQDDDEVEKQNNELGNNHPSMIIQNHDDIEDLRMIFIDFFYSIEQPKGLILNQKVRKQLRKVYPYQFDIEHKLDPEGDEVPKIQSEIQKIHIFDKNYHMGVMNNEDFKRYIEEDVETMVNVFKEVSYIFCREVTSELYSILRKLCNIAIQFKNREGRPHMSQRLEEQFMEFGRKIARQDDNEHKYSFFGFTVFDFPTKASRKNTDKTKNIKKPTKYSLRPQFRNPGTEFAAFTKKAGIHLLSEHLARLKCFSTLV